MDYIAYSASALPRSCGCWHGVHTHVEVKLNEAQYLVCGPNSTLNYFNVNPFPFSQAKALSETPRTTSLATGEWKQHWQDLSLVIPTSNKSKWQFFSGWGRGQFCVTSWLKYCAIKKAAWSLIEKSIKKGFSDHCSQKKKSTKNKKTKQKIPKNQNQK